MRDQPLSMHICAAHRWGRKLVLAALFCAVWAGCDRTGQTGSPDERQADASWRDTPVGNNDPSFVSFLSSMAEVAVVHRFDRDTDGNGRIEARVGQHGEPEGDLPSTYLYWRASDEWEEVDEIISFDHYAQRHLVVRKGDTFALLRPSTRRRVDLTALIDPRADEDNPCQPPRQAGFDPTGRWLGVIGKDGRSVHLLDVQRTGSHAGDLLVASVVTSQEIWRVDPMPLKGFAALRVVEEGQAWPIQKTTCRCPWCPRFASSIGTYGWDGHATAVLATPTGQYPLEDRVHPVSKSYGFFPGKSALVHLEKKQPHPCSVAFVPTGSARAIGTCDGTFGIFDPESAGEMIPLDRSLRFRDRIGVADDGQLEVTITSPGTRVGILNLDSGHITPGPAARVLADPPVPGFSVSADGEAIYISALGEKRFEKIEAGGVRRIVGNAYQDEAGWAVLDLGESRSVRTPAQPRFVARNGCHIVDESMQQPMPGPRILRCP